MMSDCWRGWVMRLSATAAGGVVAVLFPSIVQPAWGEQPPPPKHYAAPASAPASAPAKLSPVSPAEPETLGEPLGEFKISFYVLTEESVYQGQPYDTPLYRPDGSVLGKYPAKFAADLRIQGSARLNSGDVLAHAGTCKHGEQGICYRILSRKRYPWGQGATGRALKILGSVAVDPKVIPYGSKIYIPELDGVELDGQTHDGCLSVDDTGGGVRGKEIDVFAGSRRNIAKVKGNIPTLRATIYKGGARCGEKVEVAGSGSTKM